MDGAASEVEVLRAHGDDLGESQTGIAFEEPGGDNAAFNVFQRQGGAVRHFWGDEMGMESADPGQDPRGAVNAMPIWGLLDITPRGRAADWYPKLRY